VCGEPSLCQSVTKKRGRERERRRRERGLSSFRGHIMKKLLCKRLTYASGYAGFASLAQEPNPILFCLRAFHRAHVCLPHGGKINRQPVTCETNR